MQQPKSRFTFTTELDKLEKEVLITLPYAKYNEAINKYNNLGGIQMHGTDTK